MYNRHTVYHTFIAKKLISSFLLVLGVLVGITLITAWVSISAKFSEINITFFNQLYFFILHIAIKTINVLIPAAVFFSAIVFSYRISSSLEYMGLASLGLKIKELTSIAAYTFAPFVLATFTLSLFLLPQIEYRKQIFIETLSNSSVVTEINSGSFAALQNRGGVIFIGDVKKKGKESTYNPAFIYSNYSGISFFEIANEIEFIKSDTFNIVNLKKGMMLITNDEDPLGATTLTYGKRSLTTTTQFDSWVEPNKESIPSQLHFSHYYGDVNSALELQNRISKGLAVFIYPLLVITMMLGSINPRRKFKVGGTIILFLGIVVIESQIKELIKLGMSESIGFFLNSLILLPLLFYLRRRVQ